MKLLFLIIVFLFVFPKKAFAYLDPGTGSYLIQLFIGVVLGGVYFTRAYWNKLIKSILSLFKRNSDDKKDKSKSGK